MNPLDGPSGHESIDDHELVEWTGMCVNVRCYDHVLTFGKLYHVRVVGWLEAIVRVTCDDGEEREFDRARFMPPGEPYHDRRGVYHDEVNERLPQLSPPEGGR